MSTAGKYTCETCDAPGEYQTANWPQLGGIVHVGDDPGHRFVVKPQCPQCQSFDYRLDQSDPWADIAHCGSCGHTDRRSLGD